MTKNSKYFTVKKTIGFFMPYFYSSASLKGFQATSASKIKLKNVNKKRMATVSRLIFYWNFSRHPLLI
jgi:hypothetical protein